MPEKVQLRTSKHRKLNPPIGADDGSDDLPASFWRNGAALIFQIHLSRHENQVATAERRPIQPVARIQNNLVRFGGSGGWFGSAYKQAYFWFVGHPAWVGNDYSRMRLRPARRLPTENIPRFHASGIGTGRAAQCAASASNSGSGLAKQRRDSSGVNGFRFLRGSGVNRSTRPGRPSFMLCRM